MNKPSKEQIEKIKEELPHPRDWMGDFYKVIWQDPKKVEPVRMPGDYPRRFESYDVELLFRRVVNSCGCCMSWELDESFKSFDEVTAVFDKFCESYMGSREEIRKGAFTEVNCYLMDSLIEGEKGPNVLESKITELVDSYNNLYAKKTHANKAKQDTNSDDN